MIDTRSQKRLVRTSLLLSVVAFPIISVTPQIALAQDASSESFDLGTIRLGVNADGDDGFQPTQSNSTVLGNTPLDELPLSIDVITPDVIEATNATRVQDAVFATTGAAIGNQFGGLSSSILLRGFNADVSDNGTPSAFSDVRQRDASNVERIEVLSGPSSALFGFGGPGGVVNVITKTPEDDRFFRFGTEISSFASIRQEFDINTPLTSDGSIKARVTGAFEGIDSFRFSDFSNETFPENRFSISPTISFDPNERLSVIVRSEYTRDSRIFDRGIPIGLDGDAASDIDDFFGDFEFSDFISENISGSVEATYKLNSNWSIKTTLAGNRNTREGAAVEPEAFFENPGDISPFLGSLPNNTILRGIDLRDQEVNEYSARVDLSGSFSTGLVSHDVVFSVDAFDRDSKLDGQTTGIDVTQGQGEAITLDDVGQPTSLTLDDIQLGGVTQTDTEVIGVSFFDKLSFGEDLHLLVGGRLDYLDLDSNSGFDLSVTEFSPRVGLVAKPFSDKGLSVFLSYGESFEPNTNNTEDGGVIGPREGRTFEAGISYTFLDDRLTASFTAFDIEEDNVPLGIGGTPFVVPTTNSSQGVELSFKGAVTENLNITANYTYIDSELGGVNGTVLSSAAGERLLGTPEHSLALLASYEFDQNSRFDGLTLTGGLRYQSSRLIGNTTAFGPFNLPAITTGPDIRVDISARYALNDHVVINAGIENLFDEEIIQPGSGFGIAIPEAGRTFFASVNYEF